MRRQHADRLVTPTPTTAHTVTLVIADANGTSRAQPRRRITTPNDQLLDHELSLNERIDHLIEPTAKSHICTKVLHASRTS